MPGLSTKFFETRWNIVNMQSSFDDRSDCLTWTKKNLMLRCLIRVQPQMSRVLCRRCAFIYSRSTYGISCVLSCTQVHAPVRATVTRITGAAPRSVRWPEDWSSVPVTPDIVWWMMAKPAKVLYRPVWKHVYTSQCNNEVWLKSEQAEGADGWSETKASVTLLNVTAVHTCVGLGVLKGKKDV